MKTSCPSNSCHHGLGIKCHGRPSTTLFVQWCNAIPREEVSQELDGIASQQEWVHGCDQCSLCQHCEARACHFVSLECPFILPVRSAEAEA